MKKEDVTFNVIKQVREAILKDPMKRGKCDILIENSRIYLITKEKGDLDMPIPNKNEMVAVTDYALNNAAMIYGIRPAIENNRITVSGRDVTDELLMAVKMLYSKLEVSFDGKDIWVKRNGA